MGVLNAKAVFIAVALIGWSGYIAARVRNDRRLLEVWGFRCANIRSTFIISSFATAIGILAMAVIALAQSSLSFHWHMFAYFWILHRDRWLEVFGSF